MLSLGSKTNISLWSIYFLFYDEQSGNFPLYWDIQLHDIYNDFIDQTFCGRKKWDCVFVNNNDFCVFADAYFRRWIRVCWYVRGFHNDINVWNKTKENCYYRWMAIGNRLRANHFVIIAKVIVVYILNTCHIWNLFIHIKTNSLLMLQVDFHRKYLLEVMIDISI